MSDYSDYTRSRFSAGGAPTLIAARNEQEDLPATLISLAAGNLDIHPIIIENGSNDETTERAEKLGATVIHSEMAFKLAALQEGMQFLDSEGMLDKPVLFTDADTLVGKDWARSMTSSALSTDQNMSRVACGAAVIWHGPSAMVDIFRTANAFAKNTINVVRKAPPIGRGHNMAINFADEVAVEAYAALDPRLFIAEEQAIIDTLVESGGEVVRSLGQRSLVLTRGDRFESVKDCFAVKGDAKHESRKRLYAEYGDIIPYVK